MSIQILLHSLPSRQSLLHTHPFLEIELFESKYCYIHSLVQSLLHTHPFLEMSCMKANIVTFTH